MGAMFEHPPAHPPSSSVLREHMLGAVSHCPRGPVGLRPLPACLPRLPIYDQSQLDRTDGWAPEARDRQGRGL